LELHGGSAHTRQRIAAIELANWITVIIAS